MSFFPCILHLAARQIFQINLGYEATLLVAKFVLTSCGLQLSEEFSYGESWCGDFMETGLVRHIRRMYFKKFKPILNGRFHLLKFRFYTEKIWLLWALVSWCWAGAVMVRSECLWTWEGR